MIQQMRILKAATKSQYTHKEWKQIKSNHSLLAFSDLDSDTQFNDAKVVPKKIAYPKEHETVVSPIKDQFGHLSDDKKKSNSHSSRRTVIRPPLDDNQGNRQGDGAEDFSMSQLRVFEDTQYDFANQNKANYVQTFAFQGQGQLYPKEVIMQQVSGADVPRGVIQLTPSLKHPRSTKNRRERNDGRQDYFGLYM